MKTRKTKSLIDALIIYAANQVYHAKDRFYQDKTPDNRQAIRDWMSVYRKLMTDNYADQN